MNLARRSWVFPVLVSCLSAVGTPAQQAPTWTAEEAGIPVLLRRLVAATKSLPPGRLTLTMATSVRGPGLQLPPVVPGADERASCVGYSLSMHSAQTGATGEGFVIYAWPKSSAAGVRAFAVTGRGIVLCTDGARSAYDDAREPEWTAAVESGAETSLEHVMTALGKGMDGQMWFPLVTKETASGELRVRGIEAGKESEFQIVVGPEGWFPPESSVPLKDVRMPAGIAVVGADGKVQLTGIAAPGLHVGLAANIMFVPVRLERTADRVEVTFDPEQLATMRCTINEAAALATLRSVASSQAQCQASGVIVEAAGGRGQYGFFAELAGGVPLRGPPEAADKKMNPPVLSRSFATVRGARVVRSGYVFQIFLPGKDGTWVAEADTGGAVGVAIDPKAAQSHWRCYAWPLTHGRSGRRAFVVDESGEVLATRNDGGRYDGAEKPIDPNAAFMNNAGDAKLAANGKGSDGGRWVVVP